MLPSQGTLTFTVPEKQGLTAAWSEGLGERLHVGTGLCTSCKDTCCWGCCLCGKTQQQIPHGTQLSDMDGPGQEAAHPTGCTVPVLTRPSPPGDPCLPPGSATDGFLST